jgi:ABC-type multidrug transport system ATPase subunit
VLINLIMGLVLMVVSIVLDTAFTEDDPGIADTNKVLKWFYRLSPGFCLGNGLLTMAFSSMGFTLGSSALTIHVGPTSPVEWDQAGRDIFFLFISAPIYFGLTVLVDVALTYPVIAAALGSDPKVIDVPYADDSDVAAEAERVAAGAGAERDAIRLVGLRKVYGGGCCGSQKKVAVHKLSFGVHEGECFGYLGINGAGKTTTMNMLTGNFLASAGEAYLAGLDIKTHQREVRSKLGYCPQFDALLELLSVRELLIIILGVFSTATQPPHSLLKTHRVLQSPGPRAPGALRPHQGARCITRPVPLPALALQPHGRYYERCGFWPSRPRRPGGAALEETVATTMADMDLVDFEHKLAGTLSGGNKRKLSVGIATIGRPPLVFLDEPSTGMDPLARRFMWEVIHRISTQDKNCTVMLTTHSMEECEALCTRVGIMVGGRLRCLGSTQHLKAKFGDGYQIDLKLREPPQVSDAGFAAANNLPDVIGADNIASLCVALGDSGQKMVGTIRADHPSGHVIAAALSSTGRVSRAEFVGWFFDERNAEMLQAWVAAQFPGSSLVERHERNLRLQLGRTLLPGWPPAAGAVPVEATLSQVGPPFRLTVYAPPTRADLLRLCSCLCLRALHSHIIRRAVWRVV